MPTPGHRFVAIGASNLTRMALALLDAARAAAGGPVDAHLALGHGRSYGRPSRVFWRGLGGLVDSPLWQALSTLPPAPTTALLMDVGNDLMYGSDVPQILGWVDIALARLCRLADRVVVIGLPLPSIEQLGEKRFALVRRVLVPGSPLTLAGAKAGSRELHAALRTRAANASAVFHELPEHWYGLDPIHVRQRHIPQAAAQWLEAPPTAGERCDGLLPRLRFLFARPAERTWFGRRQQAAQPVRRWRDGSALSLW
jgi:hypothetical protein